MRRSRSFATPASPRPAGGRRCTTWWRRFERLGFAALALVALVAAAACSTDSAVGGNPPVADDAPRVAIETDRGTIVIGLYEQEAPVTVENFLAYVDAGFFDGTAFHRVIPDYMIQGGGYIPQGDGRFQRKDRLPPIPLETETGLKNLRGTISMARGGLPDTASSEFFINLSDNQRLDRLGTVELGYAVFGVVLEGMEVVDAIAAVETQLVQAFPTERATPVEDVVILSIRRR